MMPHISRGEHGQDAVRYTVQLHTHSHVRVGARVKARSINQRQIISSMTTGPALKPIATDCGCFSLWLFFDPLVLLLEEPRSNYGKQKRGTLT